MSRAGAALLLTSIAVALACGSAGEDPAANSGGDFNAPPSLRATLVLEPARLEIGEVTVVKLAVVTPPGVNVLPIAPVELPGLWLLGMRSLPTEAGDERWVHRTEFRVRPRELGTHAWPEMNIQVEADDGRIDTLKLAPRSFEVLSVKNRFPGVRQPFGVEELASPEASDGSFRTGLLTGVGASFALLLCALALRRAAAHRAEANLARAVASRASPAKSLAAWSRGELERALASAAGDPQAAANAGARLLRIYMARRYGGGTETATTEELGRQAPTLAQRSLWPDFVGILQRFDDLRFRPDTAPGELARRTERALEDSLRLLEASTGDRERGQDADANPRASS